MSGGSDTDEDTFIVHLTEGDINKRVRRDCDRCPLVRALMRTYPERILSVVVGARDIWVNLGDGLGETKHRLTPEAASWVRRFDEGHSFMRAGERLVVFSL